MLDQLFDDLIRKFRKFSDIGNLDRVVTRMVERSDSEHYGVAIISAADHRRAEILSKQIFNPGKVPAYAWSLVANS
jgi:hypothetical protein